MQKSATLHRINVKLTQICFFMQRNAVNIELTKQNIALYKKLWR
jgi:hypothetical protein